MSTLWSESSRHRDRNSAISSDRIIELILFDHILRPLCVLVNASPHGSFGVGVDAGGCGHLCCGGAGGVASLVGCGGGMPHCVRGSVWPVAWEFV